MTSPSKSKTQNDKELDFIKRTCDPCKFESNESQAQGFCRVCREYLCEKCEQFHRKFQATRSHKIVHGVLMPKPVKKSMTTCEYHPNNRVEYFCKDHGDVICSDCKELKHGICRSVVSLEYFQSTDIEPEQLSDVAFKLTNVVDEFKNVLKLRRQDRVDMDAEKTKCQEKIWKMRSDFNTILDKLDKDLQDEVTRIHNNERQSVKEHETICEKSIQLLEAAIENVKTVGKTENNLATFSTFQKAKKKLREYENVIRDVKRNAHTIDMDIKPNAEVNEFMKRLVSLGDTQVVVVPRTYRLKLKDLKKDNMRVVETLVHSVRMQDDDEKHDCEITGSTFLHDGSLVVCDKHNYKVKLLDRRFLCKFNFKLDGAPWDVAEVNANWIVTSVPFTKKLAFLHANIKEGLRKGRVIQLDRMCWGVACSAEELFVSCHDNPGQGQIYILDKRGHKKKVIDAEAENSMFTFELPAYLAVSEAADKIFIADGDLKRTITCLGKKQGDVIYDYSVSEFGYSRHTNTPDSSNPWSFKIIVDEEDYVFANVGDKDMIQVVSPEGVKYKTVLRNTEKLFGPHTMSYRESDATLIIGLWDQIQSFRFKEIEIKT